MLALSLAVALFSQSDPLRPRLHGPDRVPAGDMAVVTATMGDGDGCVDLGSLDGGAGDRKTDAFQAIAWRLLLVGSEKQIRVAVDPYGRPEATLITATEGRYEFLLIVSDGDRIAIAKHVVTVGGQPPAPGPSPGPGPDPPSPTRFGATEAARQWAAETPDSLRPRLNTVAQAAEDVAKKVRDGAVMTPQEVMDALVKALNDLGPEGQGFRDKFRVFTDNLKSRLRTSRDVAEYAAEIAAGIRS